MGGVTHRDDVASNTPSAIRVVGQHKSEECLRREHVKSKCPFRESISRLSEQYFTLEKPLTAHHL